MKRIVCAALGAALAFAPLRASAAAGALNETTTVSTLAGSGEIGFADGARASFVMPTGVAYAPDGTLYVSDGGAQRIRRVSADGSVTTIAGGGAFNVDGTWVAGAYADGKGAAARFDRPAGIAVRGDGTLYVADTFNHCIRRVTPDGDVTTYAGSPAESAHVDGRAALARFDRPAGMAIDAAGNLYVADYSGVRKIDNAGNVTTIPSLGDRPYAVAVFDGPLAVAMVVGDRYGIVARLNGLDNVRDDRRFVTQNGPGKWPDGLFVNNVNTFGNVGSLAMLDRQTVVFSDDRTNAVRLLEVVPGEAKILAGSRIEDASGNAAAFADGAGPDARFFAPLGVARAPDGGFVVADAGNRRIRKLSPIERVDPWGELGALYPGIGAHPDPHEARVAFVGDSMIWFDTYWNDSIEGLVQARLSASPALAASGKTLRIIPVIDYSLVQFDQFAKTIAQSGLYDMLVVEVNWGNVLAIDPSKTTSAEVEANPKQWEQAVTDGLKRTSAELEQKHVPLLVVVQPVPFELSPEESLLYYTLYNPGTNYDDASVDMSPIVERERDLVRAVQASGVPTLDLWPAFLAEEKAPDHRALFGSGDYHLTAYGRALAARSIGDAMLPYVPALVASGAK